MIIVLATKYYLTTLSLTYTNTNRQCNQPPLIVKHPLRAVWRTVLVGWPGGRASLLPLYRKSLRWENQVGGDLKYRHGKEL